MARTLRHLEWPPAQRDGIASTCNLVASLDDTVLIHGEAGAGKDYLARAIHQASPRRDGTFVKVVCGRLPGEALDRELFGYDKGAFPGAERRTPGRLEFAHRGTLYLDGIDALTPRARVRLASVLRTLAHSRSSNGPRIHVDVRVVASTSSATAVPPSWIKRWAESSRHDVIGIRLPPLRERKEELHAVASGLLARFNREYGRSIRLTPETLALFGRYTWPGNVRELEELIRRLVRLGDLPSINDEMRSRLKTV